METTSANAAAATHSAFTQPAEVAVWLSFSIARTLVMLVGGWVLSGMVSCGAFAGRTCPS